MKKINENIFYINNFFFLHDKFYNFILNNKNNLNIKRYDNNLDIKQPNAYRMNYFTVDNSSKELSDFFSVLQKETENAVNRIWTGKKYCHWQDSPYLGTVNIYQKGDYQMDHNDFYSEQEEKKMNYSCVYYINDNYEGGNLSFPELNISFKPQKNSLVLFLSKLNHRSEIITSGEKMISAFFYRNLSKT